MDCLRQLDTVFSMTFRIFLRGSSRSFTTMQRTGMLSAFLPVTLPGSRDSRPILRCFSGEFASDKASPDQNQPWPDLAGKSDFGAPKRLKLLESKGCPLCLVWPDLAGNGVGDCSLLYPNGPTKCDALKLHPSTIAQIKTYTGHLMWRGRPLCQRSCRPDRIGPFGGADIRKWLDTDRRTRIGSWRDCCRRRVRRWSRYLARLE